MSAARSGILLVDKPAGISSARAVAAVKRRLGASKVGHSGTLDPQATGLLICLIGRATRLAGYAEGGEKIYAGTIDLGVRTATDDIWGEVESRVERVPPFSEVDRAAAAFVGRILQAPPRVSAVKIGGQRAYRLARAGRGVEPDARPVDLRWLRLAPVSDRRVFFRAACSKGFYVRSLARDLGAALGCGGCLSSLRREESRPFSVSAACPLEEASWDAVLEWSELFPRAPRIDLPAEWTIQLNAGDQRRLADLPGDAGEGHDLAVYCGQESGRPQGVLVREASAWKLAVNVN